MQIAIIMASRGLVFSKTVESVISNILENPQHTYKLYMAHNRPLPQCFNEPLEAALLDKPEAVWFVEEDMVIGKGALAEMVQLFYNGYKVSTGDYVDRRTKKDLVARNELGTVLFSGMGCLFVAASLIAQLPKPYIRQGCFYLVDTPLGKDYEYIEGKRTEWYGTQDVYFTYMLRKLAGSIAVIKAKIGHLELIKSGADLQNNGVHDIMEYNLINKVEAGLVDTIGFFGHNWKDMLVKVNHTGVCMGYNYYKGVPINLPDDVINAIGRDNVEVVQEQYKPPRNTVMESNQVKTK